ncbi:MAG: hypothetical protein RMH81_01545 [Thermomicrobium sp.]|nr:hypothetical protein [Thermomicrobium sp.]
MRYSLGDERVATLLVLVDEVLAETAVGIAACPRDGAVAPTRTANVREESDGRVSRGG